MLCFLPFQLDPTLTAEDLLRPSKGNSSGVTVANPVLVPACASAACESNMDPSSRQRTATPPFPEGGASSMEKAQLYDVFALRMPSESTMFQEKSYRHMPAWHPGDQVLRNNTSHTLRNRWNFVVKGRLITTHPRSVKR